MFEVGSALTTIQGLLTLTLWVLAFGLVVFAVVDAARARADAFPAAGKLTKPIWLGILALATALMIISFPSPLSIFAVLSIVAAGVYVADVRPAVRGSSGGRGGYGGGPYGGW